MLETLDAGEERNEDEEGVEQLDAKHGDLGAVADVEELVGTVGLARGVVVSH